VLYVLKAAKASKDTINIEVQQLLLLKASYKKLSGHDYQPLSTPPTTSATSSALPTPTTTTTTSTGSSSSISGSTKATKESSSSSKNKDSHKPTTTTTTTIDSSTVSLVSNPFEGLVNDPNSYVLIIIHTIDNTSNNNNNNNNNQANSIEQQDITRCILVASLYNITLHIINRDDDSIYKATVDELINNSSSSSYGVSIIPIYPVLLHNKRMIFTASAICRYISALKSSSSSSSSSNHDMIDRYLDWYDYSLVPSYSKIIMTRSSAATIDTATQGS
jgi:hypothetical protein